MTNELKKTFGNIVKTYSKTKFDEATCADFFRSHLKENSHNRSFGKPAWMKHLDEPEK